MECKSNKLVAGVGVNDADYPVVRFGKDANGKRNREWICPFYNIWSNMLNRCYRKDEHNRYAAYEFTTVCEEWHTFSNFKAWMKTQDWEGKQLDKDLLTDENQYSPRTCMFIPSNINTYISGDKVRSDVNLLGVYKEDDKYHVSVRRHSSPDSRYFRSALEAITYYRDCKLEGIYEFEISKDVEDLLVSFFHRRYVKQKQIILDNPEQFPTRVSEIKEWTIPQPGDRFRTYKGDWYHVVEYINSNNIIIEFDEGGTRRIRNNQIKTGNIKYKASKERTELAKIRDRLCKYFKISSTGLVGIYKSGPGYSVSIKGKLAYTRSLEEALHMRKKFIDDSVQPIISSNKKFEKEILEFINSEWLKILQKFRIDASDI